MLIFISSESFPAYICALPDLSLAEVQVLYIYMYEGNSKSKVPYFIPASSWQAWVLSVHMFTIT